MTATLAPPLPVRVATPPPRPTMLYDGRCRICTAGADQIRALDRESRIDVLSLHEPAVAHRFPEVTRNEVLRTMHFILPDGVIFRGAYSFREILRLIPGYRWIALLWLVPGFAPLADAGYAWLAKNRYRFNKKKQLTCEGDVCRIHD